jgi:hypothetical protein
LEGLDRVFKEFLDEFRVVDTKAAVFHYSDPVPVSTGDGIGIVTFNGGS